MPCKWDHEPCRKQGCSEWDCAGLNTPEECRHWEPIADPLPKPFLPPNIEEITRGVVAKTPNNREVRVRKQGGFEVQPHNDNYWIACATLEDAAAAFLGRSFDFSSSSIVRLAVGPVNSVR